MMRYTFSPHQPPAIRMIDEAVTQANVTHSALAHAIGSALVRHYGAGRASSVADAIVKAVQVGSRA